MEDLRSHECVPYVSTTHLMGAKYLCSEGANKWLHATFSFTDDIDVNFLFSFYISIAHVACLLLAGGIKIYNGFGFCLFVCCVLFLLLHSPEELKLDLEVKSLAEKIN